MKYLSDKTVDKIKEEMKQMEMVNGEKIFHLLIVLDSFTMKGKNKKNIALFTKLFLRKILKDQHLRTLALFSFFAIDDK